MNIEKFKHRIEHFDYLVRHKISGTPIQFATKLGMSKSSFYCLIDELISMDVPITYNKEFKYYEYSTKGKINFGFTVFDPLYNEESAK